MARAPPVRANGRDLLLEDRKKLLAAWYEE
jgi:hypothetical protein